MTCWCHTDSVWLHKNPPPPQMVRKCDGDCLLVFFYSVSTSNDRFISVCFANTEAQMVSAFTSGFFFFWSLWRRYMCSFSATITAVHPSCCIPLSVLNANLFVRAESRSTGTSSRLSSRFSGIISQGETESKQQAAGPASRCPCVLQHSH